MNNPLASPPEYEDFIYNLPNHYPFIKRSSLIYIPLGTQIGKCVGMVIFADHLVLCVQEFLNFELGVIEGYSYEVSRCSVPYDEIVPAKDYCRASYAEKDKEYWYDSFPHPHEPRLAITHPHHKHVHPDIKHHRIPTFDLTFMAPNLPFLIEEIAARWNFE
jgi:hypothetical protein